jgi:hypothetical protein
MHITDILLKPFTWQSGNLNPNLNCQTIPTNYSHLTLWHITAGIPVTKSDDQNAKSQTQKTDFHGCTVH